MGYYDKKAGELQFSVRLAEGKDAYGYSDAEVQRAIVHARQDIVLVVSHLSSINQQLSQVNWLLGVVATLLSVIVLREFHVI